ncbi:MAG: YfaZ family outer membrane protein [Pseudomonadota bacterium]
MMKRSIALSLMAFAGSVQASGLDISLSGETASIVYLTDSSSIGYGGADVGFGAFFNEDSDVIATAQFNVIGKAATENQPVQFGVGAKAYLGVLDDADVELGAIAIGAQARYVIPSSVAPMAASATVYYAPDVTSFGDTESLLEIVLRYEFEIVPSTSAYVGYRLLEADFEEVDNVELDDEIHFGIRFSLN